MRGLKIFSLILIAIIMIISGWVYLAVMSAEKTILSSDYYEDLFNETDLIPSVYEELTDSFVDIVFARALADMDRENRAVFEEEKDLFIYAISTYWSVLDPLWIESQLLLVVEDVLTLIRGEQQVLTAVINMDDIENSFREIMVWETVDLPMEQLEELGGHTHPAVVEARAASIARELGLSEEINLARIQAEITIPLEAEYLLSLYQQYRHIYIYLAYLLFGILLVSMILLAKPAGGLKWFGMATIIFSLSFLLSIRVLESIVADLALTETQAGGLPLSIGLIENVFAYIAESISTIALISAAVGLAFLILGVIWSFVLHKKVPS